MASSDETLEHLKLLFETKSLKDEALYSELLSAYKKLSASIALFIIGVERDHTKPFYLRASAPSENPESRIKNRSLLSKSP
jgi:hypothetical protein